jgi:hypothetical protein
MFGGNTGIMGDFILPQRVKFNDWYILMDASGTVDIDVIKGVYSTWPNTQVQMHGNTGVGVYSATTKGTGTTSWWGTPTGAQGDIIRVNVAGLTVAKAVTLGLGYNRY